MAYNPPQGDPSSRWDWKKYGPGTIIRKDRFEYEQGASFLIGEEGVTDALSPQQAAPYNLFDSKVISGNQLDASGGYKLQGVADIKAAVNSLNETEVEVKFGATKISQPLALGEFRKIVQDKGMTIDPKTRLNLRQGKSDIITAVVFTDSLTYTFKKKTETGGSVKVDVNATDLGELTAKGYKTINGSVVVPGSTFLYYRPMEDVSEYIPR